jgi:hypothetical protein
MLLVEFWCFDFLAIELTWRGVSRLRSALDVLIGRTMWLKTQEMVRRQNIQSH